MSSQVFKGDYAKNAPGAYRYFHKVDWLKTLKNKFSAKTRALFAAFPFTHPIGSVAPDLQLETIDGRTVSLNDFRGKKHVVLEFGSYA